MWNDEVEEILAADLTAGLAYVTPAGGAVVTAVAPIGLHDRASGTVGFTTSQGFGRKLERIRRNPQVALAYHAREHGSSRLPHYVLVQGRATPRPPDRATLEALRPNVERFLGPPRTGRFWDRWLAAYYADRLRVDVEVERVIAWPAPDCSGPAVVHGAPQPAGPAAPQAV
ncbi:MAG: pyridoxamine 5'-phosphate oxidase family protein, partial [Conexibacter sp.]